MLLCDFSVGKGKLVGTEIPIIEGETHSYTTKYHAKSTRSKKPSEVVLRDRRMSTAHRYPDENWNSDNSLLRASGSLRIPITPYLNHNNKSGWQDKPDGRGYLASEKNDDRRTRTQWVQDLEKRKHKENTKRTALNAIKRSLMRWRVDPWTNSHGYERKNILNHT